MELEKDRAARHAKALLEANEAWFYNYHVAKQDLQRYENALAFYSITIERLKARDELKED